MLTTAVVGGIADGARILVGAAASLGTSGTVVVPVASFVAVATLRRLASALQSTNLRLRDATGMGTTHPSRALSTLAMLVAVLWPELADVGRLRRLLR